tara:strand:+ start:2514 stop:2930 length:417 start_codon:yes stop_codon:yes gene_type:complete
MKYHPGTVVRSLGISDFRIDGVPTNEEEFLSMFHKRLPNGTYTNDSSQFGVTWDQVKTKLDELNSQEKFRLLREERDRRLTECDWIITKNKELGTNIPVAWKTYRQSLRDLPSNSDPKLDDNNDLDMSSVVWPTKPTS